MSATKRHARRRTAWCCIRTATTTPSIFITCTVFGRTISVGGRDAGCRSAGGRAADVHYPGDAPGPIWGSPSSAGAGWPPHRSQARGPEGAAKNIGLWYDDGRSRSRCGQIVPFSAFHRGCLKSAEVFGPKRPVGYGLFQMGRHEK